MIDRIVLVGEIAFISFVIFGACFAIMNVNIGGKISAKLQKKMWCKAVILAWAAIAFVGIVIAILGGFII